MTIGVTLAGVSRWQGTGGHRHGAPAIVDRNQADHGFVADLMLATDRHVPPLERVINHYPTRLGMIRAPTGSAGRSSRNSPGQVLMARSKAQPVVDRPARVRVLVGPEKAGVGVRRHLGCPNSSCDHREQGMNDALIVEKTAQFVRNELFAESSGHDWWHAHRVRRLALALARREGADLHVTELAALLHDISDYKLNGGDHEKGPLIAFEWLTAIGESRIRAGAVAEIIANMSFKGAGTPTPMATVEGRVVQDADRLDALGAIGIGRTFAYGGYVGQVMHDPDSRPQFHATHRDYLNRQGTVIDHFAEKLLLLKDRMNTETARVVAERRHRVLEEFLREFHLEWAAEDVGEP
ncbi:HD domain-containing protein [Actinosynnema sp. NPDC053489]|uniref:HD domain-containing protein n=1 Tax=Actinosynnema sp. NPDC053489 TaxID=3363916 RepID=UPI0037C5D5AE